jgi:ribosomal protein S18 acetylase RimI-like enzyme
MDTLILRDAQESDLDAMVDLLQQLFAIEADFNPEPDKQRRGLALMLAQPGHAKLLVAEFGGRVVGMLTAQVLVSTGEGARVALLEDMVVDAGHRGRGVGGALLGAMEAWAVEAGLPRLQLLADRQNAPALEFYKRSRWTPTQLVAWRKHPAPAD